MAELIKCPELCAMFPTTEPSAAFGDLRELNTCLYHWLADHGVVASQQDRKAVAALRMPFFAARFSPGCRTQDDAHLYCAWMAFMHLFDDRFDVPPLSRDVERAKDVIDEYLRATASIRLDRMPSGGSGGPFMSAFLDLLRWTHQSMSAAWRDRYLDEVDVWMSTYTVETAHRAAQLILTPDELILHKRRCMADTVAMELFQRVSSGELSAPARQVLLQVRDVAIDIHGALNDPASLTVELARGDVHNLVLSLMHHRRMSEEAAVAETERLVREWTARLVHLAHTLPDHLAVRADYQAGLGWITACCASVRGYYDWLFETRRYDPDVVPHGTIALSKSAAPGRTTALSERGDPVTNTLARVPGALPVVGHAVALWKDPLGFLSSLPSHGELVEIRIGPHAMIMVCDPVLTRQVLLDDRTFDKGGPIFDRGREVLGNGLVTCKHSDHRRQRRLTQPSFHQARMAQYAEIMTRHVDDVTGSWHNGQVIDILSALKTITARVTAETVFTTALPPHALDEVVRDFTAFSAGVYTRMFMPRLITRLPTRSNRRYELARTRLRQKISDVITERRAKSDDRGDLLSVLLAAYGSDKDALSEAELNDQVMTFFFGGIETTAITLAWALHLIAQHPDIERRLHAEADTILGGRPASFADLTELRLTRNVITETLRLYPPA